MSGSDPAVMVITSGCGTVSKGNNADNRVK